MAIAANRYLTLFLLLVAASLSYAIGFLGGVMFFVAIGAIFESIFWFRLIFRRKRRQ